MIHRILCSEKISWLLYPLVGCLLWSVVQDELIISQNQNWPVVFIMLSLLAILFLLLRLLKPATQRNFLDLVDDAQIRQRAQFAEIPVEVLDNVVTYRYNEKGEVVIIGYHSTFDN